MSKLVKFSTAILCLIAAIVGFEFIALRFHHTHTSAAGKGIAQPRDTAQLLTQRMAHSPVSGNLFRSHVPQSGALLDLVHQTTNPDYSSCNANAPMDASVNQAADKVLAPGKNPYVGEVMDVDFWAAFPGSPIRMLLINGNTAALAQFQAVTLGPNIIDSIYQFGTYPGNSFRYRFEMCDSSGTWHPIISPTKERLDVEDSGTGQFYDALFVTYGSSLDPKDRSDPAKVTFTLVIIWVQPPIVVRAEAEHHCSGFGFEVATNYARASTFIQGHESDGPYPVKTLGVAMKYGGNFQVGTHDDPNHPNAGNPNVPGSADSLSPFPYGSPIQKTVQDASYVDVSDQLRALFIDVCGGFESIAADEAYDGRVGIVGVHSQ